MKHILVFMALILLVGCNNKNDTSQEVTPPIKTEANESKSISEAKVPADGFDFSTYHQCWGALIEGSEDALSIYAIKRSDCRQGRIIVAYKELVRRENGKPIYHVGDTMSIKHNEGIEAYLTTCNQDGKRGTYFLLINEGYTEEYFKGVKKAWQANPESKQLVSVQPEDLKCLNMDYGAQ